MDDHNESTSMSSENPNFVSREVVRTPDSCFVNLLDYSFKPHYKYVNCKYYCLRIYYKENRTIITYGLGKKVFVGDCIIKVTPSNVAGKIETILVFQ